MFEAHGSNPLVTLCPYPWSMARSGSGIIRGSRAGSGPSRSRSYGGPKKTTAETPDAPQVKERLTNPEQPREIVDHTLSRRAAVYDILRTGGFNSDACDADPYLLRAAKWFGEPRGEKCPVCRKIELVDLTYVYSKELGAMSGYRHPKAEVSELAKNYGVLRVFVVEVCQGCHWNHVVVSYVVGDGIPRRTKRRPKDLDW